MTRASVWEEIVELDRANVSRFELSDLLAKLAALQLCPPNASSSLRLQAIAHALVAIATTGRSRIGPRQLGNLVNRGAIAQGVAHLEDPPPQPFVSCLTFFGGTYRFVCGSAPGIEYVARHFGRALALPETPFPDRHFQAQAIRLWKAGLVISEEMCRAAALARYIAPEVISSDVVLPNSAVLQQLVAACRRPLSEVAATLELASLRVSEIASLVVAPGRVRLQSYSTESEPLEAKPFLVVNDEFIIANPSGIIPGCIHATIELARSRGMLEELSSRIAGAIWNSLSIALNRWSFEESPVAPFIGAFEDCLWHEAVVPVDTDKALHVVYLSDPLRVTSETSEEGFLLPPDLVGERIGGRRQELYRRYPRLNEVCTVVLAQPVLSPLRVAIAGDPASPWSADHIFFADEMEVMIDVSNGNGLLLRQFAETRKRITQHGQIYSWSFLDELTFFLKRQEDSFRSVGRGDISIESGFELSLRMEVARHRDRHGVVSSGGGMIEVVRRWDGEDLPIYFVPTAAGRAGGLCVETKGCTLWVYPVTSPSESGYLPREMLDMVAFWLSQLSPELDPGYARARGGGPSLAIGLMGPKPEIWTLPPPRSQSTTNLVSVIRLEDGSFQVEVLSGVPGRLTAWSNEGERAFMKALLSGIRDASGECKKELSDARIDGALERHAPIGAKKMFHAIPSDFFAGLRGGLLSHARLVQPAEEDKALEELGDALLAAGMSPGLIDRDGRNRERSLNDMVKRLFQMFVKDVQSLSPQGLLEALVSWNDSVVAHDLWHGLTLANRLACFCSTAQLRKEYTDELGRFSQTGVSLRWVIEYVVAQPPTGLRPFSLAAVDRLLACASCITRFGMESEYLHYGIGDVDVRVLPSGRPEIEGAIGQARAVFLSRRALGLIRRNQDAWSRGAATQTPEQAAASTENSDHELEAVTRAEFGFSVGELEAVHDKLLEEFDDESGSVCVHAYDEVLDLLGSKLGWPQDRVVAVVSLLSLGERPDFMRLPLADEKPYPWKFGRSYSLVRRPLLVRRDEHGSELIWGRSHLARTRGFLRSACSAGRMRARSHELREYMGRVHAQEGREFERKVAEIVEQHLGREVRRSVRKVGGRRLVDGRGRDLGDIDVLAADVGKRLVVAIECKDLGIGRTPAEVANEIESLFRDRPDNTSTRTKHMRRVRWLRMNLAAVLEFLRLVPEPGWRVEPLLVTSAELLGPELEGGRMRAIALTELEHDGLPFSRKPSPRKSS